MDLVGRTIGDYDVLELIGQGGMGSVYRARHRTLPRDVALKVRTRAEEPDEDDEVHRFRREAVYMAQLSHANVVKVFDAGVFEGMVWIAMELLSGKTMSDHLTEQKRIPAPRACAWIREACRGLAALHELNITHRDIKPDNLMITAEGAVKVMDLGLAREDTATILTAAGELVGTPAYLAPETLALGVYSPRSDVYQMGVVLYLLITGELPHQAATMQAYLNAVMKLPPTPPQAYVPGLPDALVAVLDRALAKRPEDRHTSASALADALQELQEELEVSGTRRRAMSRRVPAANASAGVAPASPARSTGLIVATIAALACLAGAYIMKTGPAPRPGQPTSGNVELDVRALRDAAERAAEAAEATPRGTTLEPLSVALKGLAAAVRALPTPPTASAALAAANAIERLVDAEDMVAVNEGGGLPSLLRQSDALPDVIAALAPCAAAGGAPGSCVSVLRARLSAAAGLGDGLAAVEAALPYLEESGAAQADDRMEARAAAATVYRCAHNTREAFHMATLALKDVDDGAVKGERQRTRAAALAVVTGMEAYRVGDALFERVNELFARHRGVLPETWKSHYARREPQLAQQLGL